MESRVTGFCLIAYFVTVSEGRRVILAPSLRADLQAKRVLGTKAPSDGLFLMPWPIVQSSFQNPGAMRGIPYLGSSRFWDSPRGSLA